MWYESDQSKFDCLHKYEMAISLVGHLWRSLHPNVTNVRYFQGYVPYEGECIVCYFMWDLAIKSLSPLKMISSYYKSLLSNRVGSICNYVPPFVLVTQRQMREMGREIDFFDRLLYFTFIHLLKDNLSLWIFEKLNFCHHHKNEEATPVSQTYLRYLKVWESVSCTGNCVYKLMENL